MPRRRDSESGKYESVYTDEQILTLLDSTRLTTTEVADELGCHRSTALARLRELEENGKISSVQAGRTLIWEQKT